jgi:uncharacterized protein
MSMKKAAAPKSTEVILSLFTDSREKVDEIFNKAMAAGGKFSNELMDQGWMYSRSFQDPDNHLWEIGYMDLSAINRG